MRITTMKHDISVASGVAPEKVVKTEIRNIIIFGGYSNPL